MVGGRNLLSAAAVCVVMLSAMTTGSASSRALPADPRAPVPLPLTPIQLPAGDVGTAAYSNVCTLQTSGQFVEDGPDTDYPGLIGASATVHDDSAYFTDDAVKMQTRSEVRILPSEANSTGYVRLGYRPTVETDPPGHTLDYKFELNWAILGKEVAETIVQPIVFQQPTGYAESRSWVSGAYKNTTQQVLGFQDAWAGTDLKAVFPLGRAGQSYAVPQSGSGTIVWPDIRVPDLATWFWYAQLTIDTFASMKRAVGANAYAIGDYFNSGEFDVPWLRITILTPNWFWKICPG